MSERFIVRAAGAADAAALERLAALDAKPLPAGPLLIAEVDGELWAAVGLDGPGDMADPFRPSGELVLLLHERARQIARARRPPRRSLVRALAERLRGHRPGAADAPLGESLQRS